MEPEISVIVPNYNHAAFLKRRLESIVNQTFQNFEIILLDDHSTDNSVEILTEYKSDEKVSCFEVNDKNSNSPFRQWQKGISLARGKYIWIAESDDCCSISFLKKIVNYIHNSPKDTGFFYCQSLDVDVDDNEKSSRIKYTKEFVPNIWEKDFVMNGNDFITKYLKHKNVIPNASAVIFQKSLANDILNDKILLSMRMAGDWLFWIKLVEHTNVSFIAEPLNYFRLHTNVSRNHNTKSKLLKRLTEEIYIRSYLTKFKIDQSVEWKILYNKWFEVNNIFSVLKPSFYIPKSSEISSKEYLSLFLTYLLSKK